MRIRWTSLNALSNKGTAQAPRATKEPETPESESELKQEGRFQKQKAALTRARAQTQRWFKEN